MDREHKKRAEKTRVIITNIFMGISAVAVVFIFMLITMGYNFNLENRTVERSGLLQLYSTPNRATVTIDGQQQLSQTTLSKMLSAGQHQIQVTKPGYDTWSKSLMLEEGVLTEIDWIRLFPTNPKITSVKSFNHPRAVSFSPDRRSLATIDTSSTSLHIFNLQGNDIKDNKISLATAFALEDPSVIQDGTFNIVAWSNTASKLLLTWARDNQTEWYLVDYSNAEKTINLTQKFNIAFDQIFIENDTASKLWILESHNLRLIDLSNMSISGIIATNVTTAATAGDTIVFNQQNPAPLSTINKLGDNTNVTETTEPEIAEAPHATWNTNDLMSFTEGELAPNKILTITDTPETEHNTIIIATGTYWSSDWIAYTNNHDIHVLSGNYPVYGKNNNTLEDIIVAEKLDYIPTNSSVNAENRIIVFASGKHMISLDVETHDYFETTSDSDGAKINWLDDCILWENHDDNIIIRDFDGDNKRKLIEKAPGNLASVITNNNRWFYYFERIEQTPEQAEAEDAKKQTESQDEEQNEANPEKPAAPKYIYMLRRESLEL